MCLYILSCFFSRKKGTQLQRGIALQNRPIQDRKQKSEVHDGVYVTRVYGSVNKGKKIERHQSYNQNKKNPNM